MGRIADLEREVRTLKYQKKQLGKQLGAAGARIYDLRCQTADLRALVQVDPSEHRRLQDRYTLAQMKIADQAETIAKLEDRVKELEAQVLVPVTVGVGGLA